MSRTIALAVAFLASAQAAPGVDLPAERSAALLAALTRAHAFAMQMGGCAERQARQDWEDRYQWAFTRLTRLHREAQGIYGNRVEFDVTPDVPEPDCTEAVISGYEDRADRALGAARDLLARDVSEMHGLWIGPIRLCGGRVERATTATDATSNPPGAVVVLHFAPAIQPVIARETGDRSGRNIAIRLDGRLLAEPLILEPVRTAAHVTADSDGEAEQIRQAALRACEH